jgi:hypothetical protein
MEAKYTDHPQSVALDKACRGCSAILGRSDPQGGGIHLYKWSLSIAGAAPPLSTFITAHLQSQIASLGIQQFVLRDDSKVPGEAGSSPADTDFLHTWVFAPRLSVSLSSPTAFAPQEGQPSPVCKIFYRVISAGSLAATKLLESTHSTTSGVDEIYMPRSVVGQLIELLRQSSTRLPEQARRFRDWDVGLLARVGTAVTSG